MDIANRTLDRASTAQNTCRSPEALLTNADNGPEPPNERLLAIASGTVGLVTSTRILTGTDPLNSFRPTAEQLAFDPIC